MMTPFRTLLMTMPVAALLLAAGCSSSPTKTTTATSSTTTSTAAATTTTTGSTGASTTTALNPTTLPAGAALPKGFTVTDLTWVSDTQGWALGTAPCTVAPCTSVAHTDNGGLTWAGLPAPKAYLETQQPPMGCSPTVPCIHGIRFANAEVGYTFGTTSLWLTTDGGHIWTEKANDSTDDLEIGNGVVVRTTPGACAPPGCHYEVQTTTVGSTTWHPLPASTVTGDGTYLALQGPNIYVGAFGHVAGGAQDAHTNFARSNDGGADWTTFADPCGVTATGTEADASAIGAAPGNYLVVGCTSRPLGEPGFVVVSTNGGATFGPHLGNLLRPPANGEYLAKISAATGQRLVALVVASDGSSVSANIAVSNDAGVTWTVTHTQALPSNDQNVVYLGFEDAVTGRAVIVSNTILTTTDGGGHWSGFTFP